MPGIVQVKVAAARDLPVMDRSSELTDAFVEVKLGQTFHRTDVCPKTLNPVWDSPWFKFSVNDEDLQDEPLQIKLMDYDTYTAHDVIGKVYICLNSLADSGSQNTLDGWFPIFDTLHGVRGEAHVIVKVEIIKDQHRFRQSSIGIRFFACSEVPTGYVAQAIHGFVEELVVNDDPEYQWIDRIRTPRASNEARQRIFSKLSGELQRKIGLKALEAGGNAIIGYNQSFDLEGESGIVVRGIGTCVLLLPSQQSPTATQAPFAIQLPPSMQLGGSFDLGGTGAGPVEDLIMVDNVTSLFSPHHPPHPPTLHQRSSLRRKTSSSSSDDTAQQQPSSPTKLAPTIEAGTSSGSGGIVASAMGPLKPILSTSEFPFYTLASLPANLLLHVGGVVSAHSVKLLDKINNPDEPETRDAWWLEVRNEVRSHAKAMGCNAVIAYTETTSICDTLCVFSAIGTAVRVGFAARRVSTPSSGSDPQQGQTPEATVVKETKSEQQQQHGSFPESLPQCSVCHVPYSLPKLSSQNKVYKCAVCRSGMVPSILLSTCDLPTGLAVRGRGTFIQARVLDPKRKMKGVDNAIQVSKQLPFLEYNLHGRLLNKMRMKGMNAIFNLRVRITVGDTMTVAIATGTAVYLECLPPPPKLIIADKDTSSNPQHLLRVEAALNKAQEENRATYNLEQPLDLQELGIEQDGSYEDAHSGPGELDVSFGKRDAIVIEDDLSLKEDHLIDIATNKPLPKGFYVSGSPTVVPGLPNKLVFGESRMISMVAKMEVDAPNYRQSQLLQKQFSQLVEQILQALTFKVRLMHPCLLSNVRYDVDLPDDDEIQVTVTAMATKLSSVEDQDGVPSYKKSASEEMIFHMEDTSTRGVAAPGQPLSSGTLLTDERKSGVVYITSLCFLPGFQVDRYLGIINLFLIRESTSIREDGGLDSFMNVFLLEGLAIARAHVTALGGNALLSYQVNDCVLLEHLNRNQAQCLLNLSGDAVLLQREEQESAQDQVNPNDSSQDQPFNKMTLLPIPDPIRPSDQSDSSSATTSQVTQPPSKTATPSGKETGKETKSKVPKVLQKKKNSKLHNETEI